MGETENFRIPDPSVKSYQIETFEQFKTVMESSASARATLEIECAMYGDLHKRMMNVGTHGERMLDFYNRYHKEQLNL